VVVSTGTAANPSRRSGPARICAKSEPASDVPIACARRVVTTRCQPVVTTRTMPQPTRTYRLPAQVTTPRDGLPDPSSPWSATKRFERSVHLHARSPRAPRREARRRGAPEPWVNGSSR
jgi:hypothetical protein